MDVKRFFIRPIGKKECIAACVALIIFSAASALLNAVFFFEDDDRCFPMYASISKSYSDACKTYKKGLVNCEGDPSPANPDPCEYGIPKIAHLNTEISNFFIFMDLLTIAIVLERSTPAIITSGAALLVRFSDFAYIVSYIHDITDKLILFIILIYIYFFTFLLRVWLTRGGAHE